MIRWVMIAAIALVLGGSLLIVGGYIGLTLLTRGVAAGMFGERTQPSNGASAHSHLSLSLIGTTNIPSQVAGTPQRFGGISGLVYEPDRSAWLAISDTWAREHYFEIRISLQRETSSGPPRYSIEAEVAGALALADHFRDPEGLAISPGGDQLAVVYEVPPIVAVVARDGTSIATLPVPPEVLAGCSSNRGLESVAWVARSGAQEIWAGTEATLKQDRASMGPGGGGASRISIFEAGSRALKGQAIYPLEPEPLSMLGLPSLNWLTDLCALPDGRVLALERSLSVPLGYAACLFVVEGAAGEPATMPGGSAVPVLVKRRLADLRADLGLTYLGNLEAMALGPPIEDDLGGRLLIIMADDNFGRDGQQGTQVIALRLK